MHLAQEALVGASAPACALRKHPSCPEELGRGACLQFMSGNVGNGLLPRGCEPVTPRLTEARIFRELVFDNNTKHKP